MSQLLERVWLTRPHQYHWCDRRFPRPYGAMPHRKRPSVEHLLPRERGGTDSAHNLVLACRHCNEARAAADHCVAALCCAVSVLGPNVEISQIKRWFGNLRGPVGNDAKARERDAALVRAYRAFDLPWPEPGDVVQCLQIRYASDSARKAIRQLGDGRRAVCRVTRESAP